MSGLRETYVRLRMQDEASSVLQSVDHLTTQVVNNFQNLGTNIDTSTTGVNSMSQEIVRLNNRLDASTTEINALRTGLHQSGQEITSLRTGLNQANQEISSLHTGFNQANQEISSLRIGLNQANQEISSLHTELNQSTQEMNDLRILVTRLEGELNQARLEIQQMQNGMQGVNQQAQNASSSFSNIGTIVAGIATSIGTIVFGATLISDALEMDEAFGRLEARTGAAGHELEQYEAIARSVFVNGFADSIGEASDSISTFAAMFPKLDYGGLDVITQGAHTIGQTWDQEAKEVGKAVATMTKTFDGLGEIQALDLIQTAFQRTGDHSDDLLDTFNEYSTQFKALGYGAEGFTATLIAGAESGAFNFDKLADTAKEGFLKMGEGSKDTRSALTAMGLNADQVITGIGQGGDEAQKSFMAVSTALASVEDPAKRNAMAIAAFGTPLEDLGPQFATFFGSVNQDLGDFEGATGRAADALKDRFGPRMQSAWRDLKLSMVEAFQTEGMQNFLGTLAGDVEAALPSIKAGFASFADTISNNIMPAYEKFKTGLSWIIDNKETLISIGSGIVAGFAGFKAIKTGMDIFDKFKNAGGIASIFTKLTNPVGLATLAIGGLVAAGVYLYQNWDTVKEKAGILKENISGAWEQIKENVGGAIDKVGGFFTGLKDKAVGLWETIQENPMLLSVVGPIGALIGAGMSLYQNWDTIKAKAGELWGTVTEKFTGIKSAVSNFVQPAINWFGSLGSTWDALKTKAGELWTVATENFTGIKQAVSDFVSPAIEWFNTLSEKWDYFKTSISNFKVPEWMSSIGGAVGNGIEKLKGLVDGSHATGLASVPHNGYVAQLHAQESVLTANQSNALRSAGILSSNSDGTPNVDLSPVITPAAPVSTSVLGGGSVGMPPISVNIPITVEGNADTDTVNRLVSTLDNKVRAIFEDIIRKELAGSEG